MASKKTPLIVKKLLSQHRDRIAWIDDILRVKATAPVENQATHVREHPVEYWHGMAWGANAGIEEVLMAHGCYRGFQNTGPIITGKRRVETGPSLVIEGETECYTYPIVGPASVDYASWRRVYLEV